MPQPELKAIHLALNRITNWLLYLRLTLQQNEGGEKRTWPVKW